MGARSLAPWGREEEVKTKDENDSLVIARLIAPDDDEKIGDATVELNCHSVN